MACRGQCAAYYAAHREKMRAYSASYRVAHPEKIAAYYAAHRERRVAKRRKRKYNLLPGEWDAMLAAQGNRCTICGAMEPGGRYGSWHTDHDHDTGLTRGILCHHCNTGIGQFRDDPKRLMAAIEYLAAATP